MKSAKLFFAMLAIGSTLMVMNSCNKKSGQEAANVKFKLTDAPAQFDAMFIDVKGVQVHMQGGGWVSFESHLGVINILDYVNGSTTVIAEGEIPAGNIDQIHLVLGSQNSVVVNGATIALTNSAALERGLTVTTSNQLQAGGNYEWTIDFDAAQSVIASAAGSFTFTPTIRLIVDPISFNAGATGTGSGTINGGGSGSGSGTINVGGGTSGTTTGTGTVVVGDITGNISGSISSTAGLASVCLTGADGITVCTMTSLTGQFTLQALAAGNYTLQIDPVLPLLNTHTMSNINVTAGQTTSLGLIAF